MGRLIAGLIPDVARSSETRDPVGFGGLLADEEASVRGATQKRRQEFAAGRWCVRRAMAELGWAPTSVPRGVDGAPGWPTGIVGSITHCEGFAAAAVAPAGALLGLGIDAEPNRALPSGVLRVVGSAAEAAHIEHLRRGDPRVAWDRLLFSAKESIHKAWYPATSQRLNFSDAQVVWESDGLFTAVVEAGPGDREGHGRTTHLEGRWGCEHGVLATVVVLPIP